MREAEFRAWLEARRWNGKPLSSISSRMSKARRFEKTMPALGFGHADLDTAFDADGMEQVTERLREWCKTAAANGTAPSELVGNTANAAMRISNVASAVRNYRQFREAETSATSAWPDLEGLRAIFLDRVPEFERFDHTDNEYERVERAYKDAMIGKVQAIAASGDDDEAAGRRIFRALIPNEGPPLRWQIDDDFTRKFPTLAPAFYAVLGRLARDTRPAVAAIIAAMDACDAIRNDGAASLTGGEVMRIAFTIYGMMHPSASAPFAITKAKALAKLLTGHHIFGAGVWRQEQVERWLDLLRRIETVMRDEWHWQPRDLIDVQGFAWVALDENWKVEDEMDDDAVLARFQGSALFRAVQERWTPEQTAAFCAIARAVQDAGLDWYHVNIAGSPVRFGRKPDRSKTAFATEGYLVGRTPPRLTFNDKGLDLAIDEVSFDGEGIATLTAALADHADAIAGWFPPQPARPGRWPDEAGEEIIVEQEVTVAADGNTPTNLILYGPPGTGKTYATAEHAVRLCDGLSVDDPSLGPDRRAALMARYAELAKNERIEFVTFHQSMAYEEFVEGLRPSSVDEDGQPLAAGFRLAPTPGIFRKIARRAELSTSAGADRISLDGRGVFKMSLGEAANPDDAYLFEDAIRDGHIVLGFNDIDWSDPRFENRDEIMAACQNADPEAALNANSAVVQMPHIFRNWMKKGDWVVVSKGTRLFRAIGIITGDYRFAPREGGDYGHQRDVAWLWSDPDGIPVEEIYSRNFSMRTTYELTNAALNVPALERYANSQQETGSGAPEPFVLIIDEINRANISKVFGELITLLEADKRIGKENELRVALPYSNIRDFGVPANLHIVGTMNTADRSIALLDTALRRRFTFEELMPNPSVLAPVDGINVSALLSTLNDRIEYLFDREHQIGHAYFLPCKTRNDVSDVMRHKVIPLLAEYFYEDWTKVAAVLGDVFPDDGKDHDGGFLSRRALRSPFAGGEGEEAYRYRWTVRDAGDFSYAKAVAAA